MERQLTLAQAKNSDFPPQAKHLALCPLKPELKAFIEGLRDSSLAIEDLGHNRYYVADLALAVSLGGHSKAQYAANASKILSRNPSIENLFCCGTGGGLSEKVKPLDVVIGNETVEHDFHSKFIKPDESPRFVSSIISKLDNSTILEETSYVVHIGGVASGNEDIVTRERAQGIRLKTQCLAVAWEGAGGARAAASNSVNFLEIRGVSDVCDESVESQFQQNLSPTMKNCARTFVKILQAY